MVDVGGRRLCPTAGGRVPAAGSGRSRRWGARAHDRRSWPVDAAGRQASDRPSCGRTAGPGSRRARWPSAGRRRAGVRPHRCPARRRVGGGQGGVAGRPRRRRVGRQRLAPRSRGISWSGDSPARWSPMPPWPRAPGSTTSTAWWWTSWPAKRPHKLAPIVPSDRVSGRLVPVGRGCARAGGGHAGGHRRRRPAVRGARHRGGRGRPHGQLGHDGQRVAASGRQAGASGHRAWSCRGAPAAAGWSRAASRRPDPSWPGWAELTGHPPAELAELARRSPSGGPGGGGRPLAGRGQGPVVAARCRRRLRRAVLRARVADLARAVFESVAWEVRRCLEAMDAGRGGGAGGAGQAGGSSVAGLALGGAGSAVPAWVETLTGITGLPAARRVRARPLPPGPPCWPRRPWAPTSISRPWTRWRSGSNRTRSTVERLRRLCRARRSGWPAAVVGLARSNRAVGRRRRPPEGRHAADRGLRHHRAGRRRAR